MDSQHKATLVLIETVATSLSIADRGRQLLQVARDYVDDGDILYARTVLNKIGTDYFTKYLPLQIAADQGLAEALAVLIDVFGADLVLTLHPTASA